MTKYDEFLCSSYFNAILIQYDSTTLKHPTAKHREEHICEIETMTTTWRNNCYKSDSVRVGKRKIENSNERQNYRRMLHRHF